MRRPQGGLFITIWEDMFDWEILPSEGRGKKLSSSSVHSEGKRATIQSLAHMYEKKGRVKKKKKGVPLRRQEQKVAEEVYNREKKAGKNRPRLEV